MLLAAACAELALPQEIARIYGADAARQPPASLAVADRPLIGDGPAHPAEGRTKRLTGDAWMVWRDEGTLAAAPGVPAYGRSQAGAVLRYRLGSGSAVQPTLFARATRSLVGPRQTEVAAGLAVNPVRSLPLAVAAEVRATEGLAGREIRPAAFAVTQLPPIELPRGVRGEVYLQAGWVGGRDATGFVDGQARLDRRITRLGDDEELRAGLAAWGGAQKGAARLDVGPSATLGFKIGEARTRVAVDYRVRVAGDAAPASGPAVTFSAGF